MNEKGERQLLFSVTANDCKWDYFKGKGAGGQKKNKTENCVRCTHIQSSAVGLSQEGRSKQHNKTFAFRKMTETKKFKSWHRIEFARRSGRLHELEIAVDKSMREVNLRVEGKDENGRWVKLTNAGVVE